MATSIAERILGRFGRKTPAMDEVAVARSSLMSGAFRLAAYSPDDLVSRRGFAVYDEMQNDAQVRSCLNTKKFAVLAKGWSIQPASDSPEDVRIAQFIEFCLNDMKGSVQEMLFKVLDAIAKGFSVCEINYKPIEGGPFDGMIGLASIKSKDPADFGFDMDEFLNVRGLTHRGAGVQLQHQHCGVPQRSGLPAEKFIVYTHMPVYELPHGQSDLRAAYKHWWSKEAIVKFWNLYMEKFGMPTAKGTYKRGVPKDQQDDLLRVLDKIQQESALVVPEDVTVELLEARRSGDAGYITAIDYHNKQIAKAILGQTLTSDEGSRVGSVALAKVHMDVLRFYLERLKRDLEETVMREQLIRRLVEINWGMVNGRTPAVPSTMNHQPSSIPRFVLGSLEEKDLELLGGLITKLIDGRVVEPTEPWIRGYLGIPAVGTVKRIWRTGRELFATLAFPQDLMSFLERRGIKRLSVGLLKDPLRLAEVSLVLSPRVAAATMFRDAGTEGGGDAESRPIPNPAFAIPHSRGEVNQSMSTDDKDREIADLKFALREKDVDARMAALKSNGKIVPASESFAREILLQGDQVVKFSDGEATVGELFLQFLETQPKVIEFSELTPGKAGTEPRPLLSAEEEELLSKLGISREQVEKHRGNG